jgi:hypothetical protein
MNRFVEHLTESTGMKNSRISHLEDLLLDGPRDADFAIGLLYELGDMLQGETSPMLVSLKWDGSPSVVFGPDPNGKGFFVATKSAFNKTPKVCYSHADIDRLYPDAVRPTLHCVFDRVQELQSPVVLQADVLFTQDPQWTVPLSNESVVRKTIGGVESFVFQPNTLVYAVPVRSPLGARIEHAALGLAIHTMYTGEGETLASYRSSPVTPELLATLTETPDVLCVVTGYHTFDRAIQFDDESGNDFMLALDKAVSLAISSTTFDAVSAEPVRALLSRFINRVVREGLIYNSLEYVEAFFVFLADAKMTEQATRKTLAGQTAVARRYDDLMVALTPLRAGMEQWFRLFLAITSVKHIILDRLERLDTGVQPYFSTPNGLQPTGPEGFVATIGGKSIKLVNRREFSYTNFAGNPKYDS